MSSLVIPRRLALQKRLSLSRVFQKATIPPTPPVGGFAIGISLSGLEDSGGTPTQQEMAYNVSKGLIKQRIPLFWPSLQPLAFGPLSPTYFAQISSVLAGAAAAGAKIILDFHDFGRGPSINALQQTSAIGASPWSLSGGGVAAPTVTLNAAVGPDGTTTASRIVFPAVSAAGNFSEVAQQVTPGAAFSGATYVSLRGNVGGEVVYLMILDNAGFHTVSCVLTTSWQQFNLTGIFGTGNIIFWQLGTDLRDTGQSSTSAQTIFADMAQLQVGSATAYAQNPFTSSSVNSNYNTGLPVIGSSSLPVSALANAWLQFSTALRADPNFSVIAGFDIMNEPNNLDPTTTAQSTPYSQGIVLAYNTQVMSALRGAGDNTRLYFEWDHYSGAWDSVTNNISQLMDLALSDPAKNSVVVVHCYLDQDSSGTHYVASSVFGQPSTAPTGINVTVNIGPQRMADVVTLANSKGCILCLGETGWSNDNTLFGGANNFAEWNQAGFNMLQFCQANGIEVLYFAGGPGFAPGYPYIPSPSSTSGYYASKDFSGNGLQATQMVIFDQFSGFSGAQPQAYAAYLTGGGIPYAPPGTPITGITIQYDANITSTINFTGHAKLSDGTDVGGTFSSSIQIAAGLNGIASLSYTPAGTYETIFLTFTNDRGLINPPAVGVSSKASFFTGVGSIAPNIYSLRLWNFTYVGNSVTLQRPQDNAQATFGYDINGNIPIQAMQDWGNSRQLSVVLWNDQSGQGNDQRLQAGSVYLMLQMPDGFPAIYIPSAAQYTNPSAVPPVGTPLFQTPSTAAPELSIYSEIFPTNGNIITSQDAPLDNFRLTAGNFDVGPNNGTTTSVATGASLSAWQSIAGSYSSLSATNNLKSYLNGSLSNQVSAPQFINQSTSHVAAFAGFQFSPDFYNGYIRTLLLQYMQYSAANMTAASANYTTYIGTPLTPLAAVAPTIVAGGLPVTFFSGGAGNPFSGISIQDWNSGSPTDSLTITLSGAAATLSGSGITGSNPYTIAAASAASVTATLQASVFTTSASVGSVVNVQISATSSAGPSATTTTPVTIQNYGIETAFTPPGGTFTPIGNFKGYMLGGPDVTGTGSSFFPFNAQIDYMASQGFGMLKLPTTQSNAIQGPTAFNPWVVSYVNNMKAVVDYAFSKGMYVLFAFYDQGASLVGNNTYGTVGIDPVATNSFADQRSRIASRFKNYPNVIIEMENEPKNQSVNQWFGAQNVGVAAIRSAGFTGKVGICPNGFQQADSFVSSGNAAKYVAYAGDSLNNFVFCFHNYLDSGNTGETTVAQTGRGSSVLVSATSWLSTNGYQGILTEFGIAPDPFKPNPGNAMSWLNSAGSVTTNMATEGPALLAYMKANPSQWMGWTEFAGGVEFATLPAVGGGFTDGGYGFNPEPSRSGFAYNSPLTPNTQVIGWLVAGL